ncbi:chain A, active ribosome inactivating protein [Tanacetum coccineum]
MFSESNKFKNKQTSKSNSLVDVTAGSSAGSTDQDVYELLVENGKSYKDAILHFMGKVINDRSSEKLFKLRTALVEAVSKLAMGKDTKDVTSWINRIKKYLARAVVMFPESARFKWVFVTLVRLMDIGESCLHTCVEPWMPKMIHSWEDISKIAADMSKIAAESKDDTKPPVEENHIYTKVLEFDNQLTNYHYEYAADMDLVWFI